MNIKMYLKAVYIIRDFRYKFQLIFFYFLHFLDAQING